MLLDKFLDKNIEPFDPIELTEGGASIGGIQMPLPAGRTETPNNPIFYELKNAIDKAFKKFTFGDIKKNDIEDKYIFPSNDDVDYYLSNNISYSKDAIINKSEINVDEWCGDIINQIHSPSKDTNIHILAGETGCGKSSFNKYFLTKNYNKFKINKIISSRIEYRKLYDYLINENFISKNFDDEGACQKVIDGIKLYVISKICRDIFLYLYCHQDDDFLFKNSNNSKLLNNEAWNLYECEGVANNFDKFHSFFSAFNKRHATNTDLNPHDIKENFREIFLDYFSKDFTLKNKLFDSIILNKNSSSIKRKLLILYSEYIFSKCGFNLYLIFDGFDYINPADFLNKTKNSFVFNSLGNWLKKDECRLLYSDFDVSINFLIQLTFRTNTVHYFEVLVVYQYLKNFKIKKGYIVAPGMSVILNYAEGILIPSTAIGMNISSLSLKEIYIDSIEAIKFELSDIGSSNMCNFDYIEYNIFLSNVRHRINFIKNIISHLFNEVQKFYDKQRSYKPNIFIDIKNEFKNLLSRKYRLVEILICANSTRYHNFININNTELLYSENKTYLYDAVFTENNAYSGYIGNAFNYHFPYTKYMDLYHFVEKIKILEILKNTGELKSIKSLSEIEHYFYIYDWHPSKRIDVTISVMLREASIEVVGSEDGGQYKITDQGDLILEGLLYNMSYLENVYLACKIPRVLKIHSKNIIRHNNTLEWVSASIFHMWILLKILKTCECKFNEDLSPKRSYSYERVRKSIYDRVEKIINASFGKFVYDRSFNYINRLEKYLIESKSKFTIIGDE